MSERPDPPGPDRYVERFRMARRDQRAAVLEGFHPLKHALRFGADVEVAASADPDRVAGLARTLAPDLSGRMVELLVPVPREVFERLVPSPPPTGVVAIARRPVIGLLEILAAPGDAPAVLLENPARLGNLGAAIRVAAAADAAGVITIGPADPWHPEALRGGAGLQFALPVARLDSIPPADLVPGPSRTLVAIDPAGEAVASQGIPPRAMLAFGSERHGLSRELLERADQRLAIPMREGVSSLNLATAVAVALYAARR